jgi:hypothetical protein
MTWQFLHAGKFVDAQGVVVERAEHEFLAKSADFPDGIMQMLARQDPARRMPAIEWLIGGHLGEAGFTQMVIRHEGADYCLRVIDHLAFEGSADKRGRAYRKRTYLVKAADDWTGLDGALPLDLIIQTPQYQEFTVEEAWEPYEAVVDIAQLQDDLEAILAGGHLPFASFMDDAVCNRISGILAALPPAVGARLDIRLGDADAGVIQAPGKPLDTQAEHVGAGRALVSLLRSRRLGPSPNLAALARTAAVPWEFAAPQWSLERPFAEIRHDVAWVVRCEAWLLAVDRALAQNRMPPNPTLPPSERLLKAAVKVFLDRDAIDRLGVLAGDEWEAAWQRMEVPEWRPVIDLLAGRVVDDGDFSILAVLPLADGIAKRACTALQAHLPACSAGSLHAILSSKQTWAKAFAQDHETEVTALAMRFIADAQDASAAWTQHPIQSRRLGKAVAQLMAGKDVSHQLIREVASVGQPVADVLARVGSPACNSEWYAQTGIVGTGTGPVAAALAWVSGAHFNRVPGTLSAWREFSQSSEISESLRHGVSVQLLEEALKACPGRVESADDCASVAAILAEGDRVDSRVWIQRFGNVEPWHLLGEDTVELTVDTHRILDELQGAAAIAAACVYRGSVPPNWGLISSQDVAKWLAAGRSMAPLRPLAAVGASFAIATGLAAALGPGNPHPMGISAQREGQKMWEQLRDEMSWMQRTRSNAQARRLLQVAA